MTNYEIGDTPFFEVAVFVSAQLAKKVTSSLDLFINAPQALTEHSVYGNSRKVYIVTIEESFMNSGSFCGNNIPNIKSELVFILCENSLTEMVIAKAIRSYRIKNKLGITFVDFISPEFQRVNSANKDGRAIESPIDLVLFNQEKTTIERQFIEGVRYWEVNSYDSLVNTIKTTIYTLALYFESPVACIDWADFLCAITSKGCGVIFLQGEDLIKLTEDCCRYSEACKGSPVAMMIGCANSDDFSAITFSKVTECAEAYVDASAYFCASVCYGPDAQFFLSFINSSLSWCWLGFQSKASPEKLL